MPLITADFVPSAVITPSGQWIEDGLIHWLGLPPTPEQLEPKKRRLRAILEPYQDCLATVVDCHS